MITSDPLDRPSIKGDLDVCQSVESIFQKLIVFYTISRKSLFEYKRGWVRKLPFC